MSWIQNKKTARALLAATLLVTAGAAAADVLIVRSSGPSAKAFAPGKRLPDGKPILLKAGDEVTVLGANGTRMLRGPGNLLPNNGSGSANSSGTGASRGRARIAAVRVPRTPNRWDLDISKNSTFCVGDPRDIQLWLGEVSTAGEWTVTHVKTKKSQKLDWTGGDPIIPWPAQIPLAEGDEFHFAWKGATAPTVVRIRILPRKPFEPEDVATALISNGCQVQLDQFIRAEQAPGQSVGQ